MICPNCGGNESDVKNTRSFPTKQQVWRRRSCVSCKFVFTTREQVDLTYLTVVKKDASRQPFAPAKLLLSLYRALDHLENAPEAAQALQETITLTLLPARQAELTSADIARQAMEVLRRFDAAAHLKYASYQTALKSSRQVRAQLGKP